jgi:hypothetical protein
MYAVFEVDVVTTCIDKFPGMLPITDGDDLVCKARITITE